MAINILPEPTGIDPQTSDWALFINNIIMKTKAIASISITEGFTALSPIIQKGSVFEIGDNFYYLDDDEPITGWSGIANGNVWIYSDGLTFWYSSTQPTFNYTEYGWYSGTNRAFFSLIKGGTNDYGYKSRLPKAPERINAKFGTIDIKRNMVVDNEMYAHNVNTGNIAISDYGESNNGSVSITTATSSTLTSSGASDSIINNTLNVSGEVQSGPNFLSSVWNASSRTESNAWIENTEQLEYGYYVVNNNYSDYLTLEMWTGSSWVSIGLPSFIMGNPNHYRWNGHGHGSTFYWAVYI